MNAEDAIAAVEEGMTVLDSGGVEIGQVERVKMGDPEAATAQGQRIGEPRTLLGAVIESVEGSEPKVPGELAQGLLRTGYVKIKTGGLLSAARYAAAAQIGSVASGTVYLTVTSDQLPTEG